MSSQMLGFYIVDNLRDASKNTIINNFHSPQSHTNS
jgi:hypothetical protein